MLLSVQSVIRPTIADIQSRISTTAGGAEANNDSFDARFSPDGRYVVFASFASNLAAGDNHLSYHIFLKDLTTGAVTRLSTDATGAPADGDSYSVQFSPDGRHVV